MSHMTCARGQEYINRIPSVSCSTLRWWSGAEAEARQQPPAVHAVVAGALASAVACRVAAATATPGAGQADRQRASGGTSDDAGSASAER